MSTSTPHPLFLLLTSLVYVVLFPCSRIPPSLPLPEKKGCELINSQAADGEHLENFDAMLDVMDMDNNDSIDINEFFEVCVSVCVCVCHTAVLTKHDQLAVSPCCLYCTTVVGVMPR